MDHDPAGRISGGGRYHSVAGHELCNDRNEDQEAEEPWEGLMGRIGSSIPISLIRMNMLDSLNLDVDEIVNSKMTKNEAKYPVEKAKGSAAKYTEL